MANIDIKVPDIGDFAEVAVIELLVKVGDTVKAEQSLITVESDKASMEIPSSHAGVVKELKLKVVAAGDSYNDTAMLGEAHGGILFHPPENVIREFPQYPVVLNYDDLRSEIDKAFLVASR